MSEAVASSLEAYVRYSSGVGRLVIYIKIYIKIYTFFCILYFVCFRCFLLRFGLRFRSFVRSFACPSFIRPVTVQYIQTTQTLSWSVRTGQGWQRRRRVRQRRGRRWHPYPDGWGSYGWKWTQPVKRVSMSVCQVKCSVAGGG